MFSLPSGVTVQTGQNPLLMGILLKNNLTTCKRTEVNTYGFLKTRTNSLAQGLVCVGSAEMKAVDRALVRHMCRNRVGLWWQKAGLAWQIYEARLIDGSAAWHREINSCHIRTFSQWEGVVQLQREAWAKKATCNFHVFSYLTYSVEYRQHIMEAQIYNNKLSTERQ